MASYEQAATTVIEDIANNAVISGATSTAIMGIIESVAQGDPDAKITMAEFTGEKAPEGTAIVTVGSGVELTQDPGGQAVIMSADTKADVVFAADSEVTTLVMGGAGDSKVVFETDKAVTVELGGGQNDSVATGSGNDEISFNGGSATVNTGEGNDKVLIQGEGEATVIGGSGDMVITLNTASAAVTIDAGDGFDELTLNDHRDAHQFSFINGVFQMHSENPVTMTNVNAVTFDVDGVNGLSLGDQVTVLATDAADSMVAKLYKVALGREPIDFQSGQFTDGNLGGLNWWFTQFDAQTDDHSIEHLVRSFLNCDEFHNLYDGKSNAEYVADLFTNLGADPAAAVGNGTAAEWIAQLDAGNVDRYYVAQQIAGSNEAVQILGINGEQYVIDGFNDGNA